MPHPWLHDDGTTVTLDLHGATVDDAVVLTQRGVSEAARRGRRSIKIIHGASTSRRLAPNRTIRQALHDLLDRGDLGPSITSVWRDEAHVIISLDLAARVDPRPMRLRDIVP